MNARLETITYLIRESEKAIEAAENAGNYEEVDRLDEITRQLYKEEAAILPIFQAERLKAMHAKGQYLRLRR